jgi:two-component system, LuxR family, sensor kinase FixL
VDLQLLEFMPDAVIVCDREGSIRYANRTTQALFGYEPAELVGRPLSVLVPDRFRAKHAIDMDSYFAAPRVRPMALGLRLVALRKDGSELPVDISLAPLQVGAEAYVIAAVRDISERRALEEREKQLKTAEEEIRHRDQVLAIASHELKTPVGSMNLQTRMLQRVAMQTASELNAIHERTGFAAKELDSIRGRVAKLESYSRRLARLIEQLVDSAHIHYGSLPLKVEDADLAELAREAVASLQDEVARSGSTVTILADAPITGRWDPIRIEQVIANLLLNAAKFGKGNPIRIAVDADPIAARVSVMDEGSGIAAEDQVRIFEQFERAAAAGGALGLGLGLYIARQIVLAHGGAISVRSAVGSGSTFTVELPRSPPLT